MEGSNFQPGVGERKQLRSFRPGRVTQAPKGRKKERLPVRPPPSGRVKKLVDKYLFHWGIEANQWGSTAIVTSWPLRARAAEILNQRM